MCVCVRVFFACVLFLIFGAGFVAFLACIGVIVFSVCCVTIPNPKPPGSSTNIRLQPCAKRHSKYIKCENAGVQVRRICTVKAYGCHFQRYDLLGGPRKCKDPKFLREATGSILRNTQTVCHLHKLQEVVVSTKGGTPVWIPEYFLLFYRDTTTPPKKKKMLPAIFGNPHIVHALSITNHPTRRSR